MNLEQGEILPRRLGRPRVRKNARCRRVPCDVKHRTYCAYGLRVRSAFDLPIAGSPEIPDEPDVNLRLVEESEVTGQWSDANGAPAWQTMLPNHCHARCERGQAGDHLLTYGRKASFHLDREGRTLLCAPADRESIEWQRFLLDTVLHCVSLIRGFEALHASAVSTPEGVVAFVAPPGGGKSTLAAELMRRGHSLFSDDVLVLSRTDGEILAHAGPPLMTLPIEGCVLGEMGEPLEVSTEDGTTWVHVRRVGSSPQPLAGIFVLDRRQGVDLKAVRETASPGRLLPHMLSLDRYPARGLSRLGLLRELVSSVPVYRLRVRHSDLAGLADVVEEELQAEGLPAGEAARSPVHHAPA